MVPCLRLVLKYTHIFTLIHSSNTHTHIHTRTQIQVDTNHLNVLLLRANTMGGSKRGAGGTRKSSSLSTCFSHGVGMARRALLWGVGRLLILQ